MRSSNLVLAVALTTLMQGVGLSGWVVMAGLSSEPVGSESETRVVRTAGFDDVKLTNLHLARYSRDLNRWVGEFKAVREFDPTHSGSTVNFRVIVSLKSGDKVSFDTNPVHFLKEPTRDYMVDTDQLYKPEEVIGYSISIIQESWMDDAEQERQAAEQRASAEREQAKLRASCAAIYRRTANKKVAELTVRESKQVEACSALGLYPPS